MDSAPIRMTQAVKMIIREFGRHPGKELYGLQVCRRSGLSTGTVYPILARMVSAGWLRTRREDIDPMVEGRPRRRYYAPIRDAEGAPWGPA